jgi:hypothetical protein
MRRRIMETIKDIVEPEKRCLAKAVAYCAGILISDCISYDKAIKAAEYAKEAARLAGIPLDQAAIFEDVFKQKARY